MATIPTRIERTYGVDLVAWAQVDAGGTPSNGVTFGERVLSSAECVQLASLLKRAAQSSEDLRDRISSALPAPGA